jgi:flagellar protein FliO/FliZ
VLELVLRVVFSLSVVLGLLWLIARVSSRRLRGGAGHSLLRTLARVPLARGSSLAVVAVGERVLVVGYTEQRVDLLAELDPAEVATVTHDPSAAPADAPPRHGKHVKQPEPQDGVASGPLGGSLLSTQTWRQALSAATRRNGTDA